MPELGCIFSVYAAGMAGGDDSGGFIMIPPQVATEDGGRKTATDPEGGVRLPGQWYCSTPGSRARGNAGCCSPTDDD